MASGEKNLWIIANFKSNKNIKQALEWLEEVGPALKKTNRVKVVICPSFICLPELKKELMVGNYPVMLGAQNISPFDIGPYTGEVAGKLLSQFVDLVILGHSERRQNFFESDEMVKEKTERCLECQIIPLVCVQDENTFVPDGVKLIAYEPIFAIGSGKPDTPENANRVAQIYRQKKELEVLYGGSVTSANVKGFLEKEDISGLLVGRASLDALEFLKIVEVAENG